MLKVFSSLKEIDFTKLMDVYEESVRKNGEIFFPDEEFASQIRLEQDRFYHYLSEVFFCVKNCFYAVWQEGDQYISALRIEPYQDGYLLSALETAPCFRKHGYGKKLMIAVQHYLAQTGCPRIYSHISNRNIASIACHRSCGFNKIFDYAVYIDGTISRNASTYRYEQEKVPE